MPNLIRRLNSIRRRHDHRGTIWFAMAAMIGVLSVSILSSPVLAQDATSESVRSKPRLDYESFGLSFRALIGDKERTGPRKPADQLNVFTRVDVGAGYRSNVLRTPDNEKASTFTSIEPRLAIHSDWDRHAVNMAVKANVNLFTAESGENKIDLVGTLNGRYEIQDDRVAQAGVELARLQSARGSADDVGPTFEPQIINRYTVSAGLSDGDTDELKLSGNAQLIRYDYQRVDGLSRDEQDSTEIVLGGVASVESDGAIGLFLLPGMQITKYDQNVNSDSIVYELAVGWSIDSSALTAASGRIGIAHRDFERKSESDITSLLWENKLLWNATPLISLRSDSFIQNDDSQAQAGVGRVGTGIDFNLDYELFDNLVFTTGIAYQNDSFKGIDRTDDTYRYSLAAMYLIGDRYFVRGDIGYESRTTDFVSEEYTDATVFLRFGMKACCLSDAGLIDAFGEGVFDVFR